MSTREEIDDSIETRDCMICGCESRTTDEILVSAHAFERENTNETTREYVGDWRKIS